MTEVAAAAPLLADDGRPTSMADSFVVYAAFLDRLDARGCLDCDDHLLQGRARQQASESLLCRDAGASKSCRSTICAAFD